MRWIGLVVLLSLAFAQTPQNVLNLYIWEDYIPSDLVQQFEKQTGIKVQIKYYGSNEEMVKALRRGRTALYDVVVPSDFVIPSMIQEGLLQPLNKGFIPNAVNLDRRFSNPPFDRGNQYTVGYLWGTVGLMYRKDAFKAPPQSWSVLFEPKQQRGRFTFMDSPREMLGIALRYGGQSVNSTKVSVIWDTIDTMIEAKNSANFAGFEDGVSAVDAVASGKLTCAVVYNQDALGLISKDPRFAFTIPKEGSTLFLDNLAIPAKAPHPEAANKFINFILDAKVGAHLAEAQSSATPNAAAKKLLRPEQLKNPAIWPTNDQMAVLEFIADQSGDNALDTAWAQVKQ